MFTATSSRMWDVSSGGWQEWKPGPGGGTDWLTLSLERRQGQWKIELESNKNPMAQGMAVQYQVRPFSCSQVPPEKFDPNSAFVQNAQKELMCRRFMAGDINRQDFAGVFNGMDARTCKDKNGRTPLMKSAGAEYPDVEEVRSLLNRGVDVNARDNGGETALTLAQKHLQGGSEQLNDEYSWKLAGQVVSLLQNAMSTQPSSSVSQDGQKGTSTQAASVPVVATPPSVLGDCNAHFSFVPLQTKVSARLNVQNVTDGILKLSKLDSGKRWIPMGELPPRAATGVGIEYAEEIWRVADGGGTCVAIARHFEAQWNNLAIGQH